MTVDIGWNKCVHVKIRKKERIKKEKVNIQVQLVLQWKGTIISEHQKEKKLPCDCQVNSQKCYSDKETIEKV